MIEYKNASLSNQVFERIEKNILSGVYTPGEIISEKRLSAELGVSRTPIREALSRLIEEGLVADTQNGNQVLGVTDKDVDDFYEVKKRLEPEVFSWAAKNIDEEGLARLQEIIDQQEFYETREDIRKIRDLDTEFHDIVYSYCGSRVISKILSGIHHKNQRFRRFSLEGSARRVGESIAEHKAILEAMRNGEPTMVETLCLVHTDHAYQSMLRQRKSQEEK